MSALPVHQTKRIEANPGRSAAKVESRRRLTLMHDSLKIKVIFSADPGTTRLGQLN